MMGKKASNPPPPHPSMRPAFPPAPPPPYEAFRGMNEPKPMPESVRYYKPATTIVGSVMKTEYTTNEAMVLLSKKKTTSHLLHLFLSVITVGFWVPVWMLCGLSNYMENARIDRKIAKGH